jgi:intracellular septation protein A
MNSKIAVHYLRVIFKSLTEFIPVFIFVTIFKCTENFYLSTFLLIISTVLFTYYTFHREKRLPYLALFICLETTVFGAMTIALKDPVYVQMRDTFYDLILGLLILATGFFRNPIIKKFFGHLFDLPISTWINLSYAWGTLL